jgi:hypothetical protein
VLGFHLDSALMACTATAEGKERMQGLWLVFAATALGKERVQRLVTRSTCGHCGQPARAFAHFSHSLTHSEAFRRADGAGEAAAFGTQKGS